MKGMIIVCVLFTMFTLSSNAFSAMSDLKKISGDPFIVDLRYNTDDNFLHKNIYADFKVSECLVRPEMAKALESLKAVLVRKKLKLVMWDCYRPIEVQREMWKLVPDENFVANPDKGSNHNRGVAVDVTLADEKGERLSMPTGFDDFSKKAASSYSCERSESQKCRNRDMLIDIMKGAGLEVLPTEWWHFAVPNAASYPIVK